MSLKENIRIIKAALKGEEHDYTQGNLDKALILLSIPVIIEMIMEALFAIVDVFFVAHISNNAVATVGITEVLLMVIESLAIGVAMGATALVSRRVGEKDISAASKVAVQAVLLGTLISVLLGLGAFTFVEEILSLTGANDKLIEEGSIYSRIILSFNIVLMLLFVLNGIFRAAGNAVIAMRTLILSNGINIVLDPILIFGLGPISPMGIKGAAIASCTGRAIGVCYQLHVMFRNGSLLEIHSRYLRPNLAIIKRLISVSAGGAGQFLIATASWLFLVKILGDFSKGIGDDDNVILAGYTIGLRIIIFSILPSWGLATATATLVGQNLGAKQPERAEKTVWKAAKWNMFFLLGVSIIYLFLAKPICGIFSEDAAVIAEATRCLWILSFGYIFFAYEMTINQAFNGSGDTATPTWISFGVMWLIQIPLAYFTAITLGFGSTAVYATIVFCNVLASIVSVVIFRRGQWKSQAV